MNLKIQENVPLAELTTFKIGGNARYFAEINSINELVEAFEWVKDKGHDYFILGGGSNTIFSDEDYLGLIIKMNIMGFEVIDEDESSSTIKVGAGEDWDETVERTVNMNLSGMEALSGVPGNTGATPVQNIGAYGQEVKDTIEFVEAYDAEQSKITKLSNEDCNFSYRDSIFKSSEKGRYIICFVAFRLSKKTAGIPQYKDVINYFKLRNVSSPNLKEIRKAILEIRKSKFVNPSIMPNAGSFFKNPTVSKGIAEKIILKYPDIKPYPEDTKIFPNSDGTYKLAAGWLIQEAGFKGIEFEKVRIDPNHALVLENKGGASQKDLMELVEKIRSKVLELFDVELEIEPIIV
jgi:UDP-N-acetylmuramate dehydrogenase